MNHSWKPNARIYSVCTALATALLNVATATAGPTPEHACQAGKNGAAGKYASCLYKAQQKFVAGGRLDTSARDGAVAACSSKYSDRWSSLEAKAGMDVCPSEGDEVAIQRFLDATISTTTIALDGNPLPPDVTSCLEFLETCREALSTCGASVVGGLPETGQQACIDAAGLSTTCTGTGQDGELRKGLPHSFTDNGDGTITDVATGLMWEKLSDDGSLHDQDNLYNWTTGYAGVSVYVGKIAQLNEQSFAGYQDWRLPNKLELLSLVNFDATFPSTFSTFHNGCAPGCTTNTCSCTRFGEAFWSSSPNSYNTSTVWVVDFQVGQTFPHFASQSGVARAVRSIF